MLGDKERSRALERIKSRPGFEKRDPAGNQIHMAELRKAFQVNHSPAIRGGLWVIWHTRQQLQGSPALVVRQKSWIR